MRNAYKLFRGIGLAASILALIIAVYALMCDLIVMLPALACMMIGAMSMCISILIEVVGLLFKGVES